MTRKEQNKILDAKIESNDNQYKVDRLNAEISAFSSGDLHKYDFLKRIDLNCKSNALDKARFEFSPLGKTFSMGLDKTAQGYQEEFWYDYMKPKYNDNVKLCYIDTDSFIMNIKTNDFYKDISNDVENRFDASNYEVNRPLPTGKNKKIIGLMKDELIGKMMVKKIKRLKEQRSA